MPTIEYHPNENGELCATLNGWDTVESVDGYALGEIDLLVDSLQEAKEFLLNNGDKSQTEFEFKGDSDV